MATLMDGAKTEVLAVSSSPRAHWTKVWSTNPLERLNKEVKRRARVEGIFPNESSVIRPSAPFSPTSTTSGKPAIAATSPKAPRRCSTQSAIIVSSPSSRPATDTEDHLENPRLRGPRPTASRSTASCVVDVVPPRGSNPEPTDFKSAPGRPADDEWCR
jgi:hypothetical protein